MRNEITNMLQTPSSKFFLASDFEKLALLLPRLVEEGRAVTCKTEILSSLYFPEMKERYDQIKEAENSFKWIL
jgi:hypothetical protein